MLVGVLIFTDRAKEKRKENHRTKTFQDVIPANQAFLGPVCHDVVSAVRLGSAEKQKRIEKRKETQEIILPLIRSST